MTARAHYEPWQHEKGKQIKHYLKATGDDHWVMQMVKPRGFMKESNVFTSRKALIEGWDSGNMGWPEEWSKV